MRVHDLDTSTGSTFFENANARIELRALALPVAALTIGAELIKGTLRNIFDQRFPKSEFM